MLWRKNNHIKAFLFLIFIVFSIESFGQREIDEGNRPPLGERLFYGGNFGMSFGTITFIDVSPLVGAMITNRLSGGVGATYQYFNDRRFIGGNSSLYGGRVFGRYNVFPNVFTHVEYENLNFDLYNPNSDRFERSWVPGFLIGGGYFTPFGQRGGANITILYNLMYDIRRSPYNEPYVIRFGFFL